MLFVAFIFSFRSNQNPFAEKAKEKQEEPFFKQLLSVSSTRSIKKEVNAREILVPRAK